jgi:hypothetical protein
VFHIKSTINSIPPPHSGEKFCSGTKDRDVPDQWKSGHLRSLTLKPILGPQWQILKTAIGLGHAQGTDQP